jgi:ketosteroid isomerase-like protein
MSETDVETVRRIYGFNWASVGGRAGGLGEMEAMVSPDFESQLSPGMGGRVIKGLQGLRDLGDALEQDFEQFSYEPNRFEEAGDGRVVVTGKLSGVGRTSKVPLSGEFGHVWHLADGLAIRCEAHADSASALSAAGVSS